MGGGGTITSRIPVRPERRLRDSTQLTAPAWPIRLTAGRDGRRQVTSPQNVNPLGGSYVGQRTQYQGENQTAKPSQPSATDPAPIDAAAAIQINRNRPIGNVITAALAAEASSTRRPNALRPAPTSTASHKIVSGWRSQYASASPTENAKPVVLSWASFKTEISGPASFNATAQIRAIAILRRSW